MSTRSPTILHLPTPQGVLTRWGHGPERVERWTFKYLVSCGWILGMALVGIMLSVSASWGQTESASGVTEAQVRQWIEDLQSENYASRESANRKIARHLAFALPLVIEAAQSESGSGAEPLLQFLGFVGTDALSAQGEQAYACLKQIAEERTTSRAVVAQRILEGIAIQMREYAIERLRQVGVTCEDRYLSVLTRTREVKNALVIDPRFSGTSDDLSLLRWLFDVEFVKLEGPAIDGKVMQQIAGLPKLNSLQVIDTNLTGGDFAFLQEANDMDLLEILYTPLDDSSIPILANLPVFGDIQLFGTKLSAAGAKEVVERIDWATVFVGRGGFLGITCEPSSLIIREVIPDGPANRAGIRTMDKLLKVDDVPISNFDDLRRELAKSADGETVIVEFERPLVAFRRGENPARGPRLEGGSPIRVEVTLGRRPSELNR